MNGPVVRLTMLGAVLAATMISALLYYGSTAADAPTQGRALTFIGLLTSGVVAYLLAVQFLLRTPLPASTLWLVLGLAALLRLAFLPAPPLLSTDIYRYVWDGKVQAAGINPYRFIPADPALAHLRDADIYPKINRADYARTIYPPAAQIVFAAVAQVSASVIGMKVAMLAFEAMAIVCILQILSIAGLPRERILIYAWNPLPLWSFAGDGHVDAIAVGGMALALLARARHRDGWAGGLLAVATLAKFLPVVVAPAFLRGGTFWRPTLVGSAVIVGLYLVYSSAGEHVLGFLGAYGNEEGYDTGSGYWLLAGVSRLVALPPYSGPVYGLCGALAYAALAIRVARGWPGDAAPDSVALCRDAAILAGFATLIVTPHYYWYYAWLALPCVVAPIQAVIWLSSAPLLLVIDPLNERFLWPALVFMPALVIAGRSMWRNRSALHRVSIT
ncbi:glycosyltransferase 87 family protein [uncultured Enterovirga sp.]|uniref:glycosyltransferase 87 family protein n=1 Tax=uncultured Enterovirga sp. TaxID=2026352 RepID=UPI0035CC1CAF